MEPRGPVSPGPTPRRCPSQARDCRAVCALARVARLSRPHGAATRCGLRPRAYACGSFLAAPRRGLRAPRRARPAQRGGPRASRRLRRFGARPYGAQIGARLRVGPRRSPVRHCAAPSSPRNPALRARLRRLRGCARLWARLGALAPGRAPQAGALASTRRGVALAVLRWLARRVGLACGLASRPASSRRAGLARWRAPFPPRPPGVNLSHVLSVDIYSIYSAKRCCPTVTVFLKPRLHVSPAWSHDVNLLHITKHRDERSSPGACGLFRVSVPWCRPRRHQYITISRAGLPPLGIFIP